MASSWADSWATSWATSWGGVAVAPPTVFYQGDGLTRRKRKRRDRTRELFDAIEATLRATLEGAVAPVVPTALVGTPAPIARTFDADLARLAQYAREDEVLAQRLATLQQDLQLYDATRRAEELSEDEDSWMLLA
jgi:hypothetical protein